MWRFFAKLLRIWRGERAGKVSERPRLKIEIPDKKQPVIRTGWDDLVKAELHGITDPAQRRAKIQELMQFRSNVLKEESA